MVIMLGLVALGAPEVSEAAHAKLVKLGPHIAYYAKESTSEPTLEVHFRSASEASAKATSPEGVFMLSVDATTMRIKLDEHTCASVAARTLIEESSMLASGHSEYLGAPTPRLVYRAGEGDEVDLSTAFLGKPSPVLFSWHADLVSDGVSVEKGKGTWEATSADSKWSISRKNGVLQRLSVGSDAVVLDRLESGKSVQTMAAAEVCTASTDKRLERQLSTQIRFAAYAGPTSDLLGAWAEIDEEGQQAAAELHTKWWATFFKDELPGWADGLEASGLGDQVVADMTERGAFEAFAEGLPDEAKPDAVSHYKRAWFDRVGQSLLASHLQEVVMGVEASLSEHDASFADEKQMQVLLLEPLQAALLARAESTIQRVVVPAVERAGRELQ